LIFYELHRLFCDLHLTRQLAHDCRYRGFLKSSATGRIPLDRSLGLAGLLGGVGGEAVSGRQFAMLAICHLTACVLVPPIASIPGLRVQRDVDVLTPISEHGAFDGDLLDFGYLLFGWRFGD
jgi:hypothetical protein